MLPDRWNEVKAKLEEALQLEPAQRALYLAEMGAADPGLRSEVESLIAAHERAGADFLEAPLVQVTSVLGSGAEPDPLPGRRIGAYRIIGQIGVGGMGEVYSAVRADDQYEKRVAIKLVRSGQGSDFAFNRFKSERQILASLDHPNIARLLDGGATEEGVPYLVMELIEGQPIDEYCDTHKLSIADRLELFVQVCSAVQFAHQHLIIHRDIKPANILVTSEGVPKLLDFGIAKILEESGVGAEFEATFTLFRVVTPRYASPEQVKGEPVTAASDVYSLGVVLYKLLTGRSPYPATNNAHEVCHAVCEFDPEKPSVAVRQAASGQKLSRRLKGDLDNIVLMALRKEPRRRYRSVELFHGDVRRHLDNLPVIARKSTLGYRSWKFITRHKVGVSATAVIALVVISALAATLHANRVAREQSEIARAQRARAERRINDVHKVAKSLIFDLPGPIHYLPGAVQVEKMLFDTGLEYLDSVAEEAEGDTALQRELASGYKLLGDSQGRPYGNHLGDSTGALASYRKALGMRLKLAQTDPRNVSDQIDLALTFRTIAALLYRMGDVPAARDSIQKALDMARPIAKANPDNVNAQRELGIEFMVTGDFEGNPAVALEHHLDARTVFRQLAERHGEERLWKQQVAYLDDAASSDSLECGKPAEAIAYAREALDILSQLGNDADAGTQAALKNQIGATHSKLGDAMLSSGNWSEATIQYRQELSLYGELAGPGDAGNRSAVADGYINTGNALVNSGNARSGLELLRKGLALVEPLVESDPKNSDMAGLAACGHVYAGEALEQLGDEPNALGEYGKAAKLFQSPLLSEKVSGHSQTAAALAKVAGAQAKLGHATEARETYLKALALVEPAPGTKPADAMAAYALIDIFAGLGDLAAQRANQDACRWYRKSKDMWMQLPVRNTIAPNGFKVTDFGAVAAKATKCAG